MTMNQLYTIDFEQGMDLIQKGITKMKNILEGVPELQFSMEEYMLFYTTVYMMCTRKENYGYSLQLYEKYRESIEECIKSTVLPALREKHDESMLRELVRRWSNHKTMVQWMSLRFYHLERNFIPSMSLTPLGELGLTCFIDLVYMELSGKAIAAVLSLIHKEREGEQIDRALLKDVLATFDDIGMQKMDYYENDLEEAMLKDTAAYYSHKASNWIREDSCPDYMLKAEECLKRETDRVSHYIHIISETKYLEKVQHQLLSVYATLLLENENSGCHALLRDGKVEDLSRMYRLFSKLPRGLEPIAAIFKQHVAAEMDRLFSKLPRGLEPVSATFKQHVSAKRTDLIKQAEDSASKKRRFDDIGSYKQDFLAKFTTLHDKYMAYVNDCFSNNSQFREALKEAFEVFCNKGVAGSLTAEAKHG